MAAEDSAPTSRSTSRGTIVGTIVGAARGHRAATPQLPDDGALASILEGLGHDQTFHELVEGHVEESSAAAEPGLLVGAPGGLRPAIAAALARRAMV
ncbi:MAG: hypothetical protein L0K48_08085, partial [Bifidobacterium mongoliense]|nr:hypothetical protein [Bifidobacterium mongoliense]